MTSRGGVIRLRYSDVTPEKLYLSRRELMAGVIALAAVGCDAGTEAGAAAPAPAGAPLKATPNPAYRVQDTPTKFEAASTYNNFYEFGVNKEDPARLGHTLKPRPWHVQVDGLCAKPKTFDIEEVLKVAPLEERIYGLRCVEAWSMVIPWIGYPLSALLKLVEPRPGARYVEFATLKDPEQFPGQKSSVLDWPYVEGLRIDEAMSPLALLAVGLYGKPLPGQNGAPLRLVVPWKYGFKGIKSIVRIRLTTEQPPTTWSAAAPDEYGFFANVNPAVDHPRWSQASERRIGEIQRRPTLPFNGYADQVAGLYAGLDLRRNF